MNIYAFSLSACGLMMSFQVGAQTPPPSSGMQTYSPYTAEQMQELNNQPLAPVEGPFGPVNPSPQQLSLSKKQSFDSKYFTQPKGEEEAEALETESAAPYQAVSPTITF